jgi:hypothetical protein
MYHSELHIAKSYKEINIQPKKAITFHGGQNDGTGKGAHGRFRSTGDGLLLLGVGTALLP